MEKNVRFLAIAKRHQAKKSVFKNTMLAGLFGGVIGILGQAEYDLLTRVAEIDTKLALTLISVTFISLAALLTVVGWYKKLGQIAGAGLFIPITGFANSMVASAVEYKFEGPIFGVGSKVFSLAGSVIIYAVVASFLYGAVVLILLACGVKL